VVEREQALGPRHAHGAHGRVVLHAVRQEGEGLQPHQGDVVLVGVGVVPAGGHTHCQRAAEEEQRGEGRRGKSSGGKGGGGRAAGGRAAALRRTSGG